MRQILDRIFHSRHLVADIGVSIGLAMMLSIAVDVFGVIMVALSGAAMLLLNESNKDET